MKRIICTATVLSMILSMTACGNDDTAQNTEKQTTTSVTTTVIYDPVTLVERDILEWCGNSYDTYDNELDAVQNRFAVAKAAIEIGETDSYVVQQINEFSGMYVYALANIPQGYSAEFMSTLGNVEYCSDVYRNAEETTSELGDKNKIAFLWDCDSDGALRLKDKLVHYEYEGEPVSEISNYPEHYYIEYEHKYFAFWCEDGFYFHLFFPKSIGTIDPETHEYSGHDIFTLRKTFYPFEETQE